MRLARPTVPPQIDKRSRLTAIASVFALSLAFAMTAALTTSASGRVAQARGDQSFSAQVAYSVSGNGSGGAAAPISYPSPSSEGGTAAGSTSRGKRQDGAKHAARKGPGPVAIAGADCVPHSSCSASTWEVSSLGGTLLVKGRGLGPKMNIAFASIYRHRPAGPTIGSAPRSALRKSSGGLVASIPKGAVSGRITVLLGGHRHTNLLGPIHIVSHKLHPPPPPRPRTATISPSPTGTAFDGQGMWIWYVSKSDGGSLPSIIAQAKAAGVSTLFVKSSDGSENYWSQFSPELVAEAHDAGLKVCAWQYVYGTNPIGEAELGAKAVQTGADCLVIDAESEYEGHYAAAQQYMQTLRSKVGANYPIGLASFPYVNYHESFPYSVFLGPGGAQFNAPQMYWKDIGVSVESIFSTTYEQNLIYGREIEPLGQTFQSPSASEIVAFRSLSIAYGASGLSWWDWQETSSSGWSALTEPLDPELKAPSPELTSPLLKEGAKGDQVLWMQEHLASAIPTQQITGIFDSATAANLEQFQSAHGLPASGETDASTWGDLLALAPVAVEWTGNTATAARAHKT
jgi:peptidoglycan hydrolase-like protein with peptidoglycan-binding domain